MQNKNPSSKKTAARIFRERFKGWAVIQDGVRKTHSGLNKKDAEVLLAQLNAKEVR